MKQVYNIFFFFTVFYSAAFAQLKPVISVGPKIGTTFSMTEKDENFGNSYQPKLNAGAFLGVHFNSWFALKTEVLYNGKSKSYVTHDNSKSYIDEMMKRLNAFGAKVDTAFINNITGVSSQYINDTIYETTRGRVNLNYIELPVLASFNFKGFTFSGGPYFAYLVSAKGKEVLTQDVPLLTTIDPLLDTLGFLKNLFYIPVPGYLKPQTSEFSSTDLFRKFDLGMVLDFTYQTPNGFNMGMRYTRGSRNYRIDPLKEKDVNQAFMFSVGYNFGALFNKKTDPNDRYDLKEKKVE